MLVEQLKIKGFGRLKIPVVNPVGGMFDERPEIVVQVEHEKFKAMFFQPLRQFDCRGGFAGRTGAADPNHAQGIRPRQAGENFFGGGSQGSFIGGEGGFHDRPHLAAQYGSV